ncbi:GNAT family N-acetyltransferase [Candidatus Dojkabacteria bacterium]|nr:GNAT family N-acetyltransferase [Candidatus Dojkabacteria bacterium]
MKTKNNKHSLDQYLNEISIITKYDSNLIFRDTEELSEAYLDNGLVLKFIKSQLAGFVMCKKITTDVYELASLYVKPKFRGKGVAKQLITEALTKVEGRNVIARTSNKAIKLTLKAHNFKPISMKRNLRFSIIYLKDRLESKEKFISFLGTLNKKNCLFFRARQNNSINMY